MAGLPAFPRDPIVFPRLNPKAIITSVLGFHPKSQSMVFLLASACFFALSRYCQNHLDDEAMYFCDIFLFFLMLIALPRGVVRARQRLVAGLRICGFAIIKAVAIHWLGNKLVAEKDVYIAIASISFFLHLIYLRVIHEITDDLGIAQGILFAGFTVLVAEYPKVTHVLGFSVFFTVLLAIMNTTTHPPPEPNLEGPVIPEAHVIPEAPVITTAAPVNRNREQVELAIPGREDGNWAESQNARWRIPRTKSSKW